MLLSGIPYFYGIVLELQNDLGWDTTSSELLFKVGVAN